MASGQASGSSDKPQGNAEKWGASTTGLVGGDPWAFTNADLPRCTHGHDCPNETLEDQLPF